jgi:RNA polymerase sigma factor (sigma-70 family)
MQDPEYAALQQEEYRQLHTVIRGLPTIQQQILHLRFGAGLRIFEIAALLNKREAAVRKQLSRTLTFLRTHYDDRRQQEGGEKL